MKNLINGKILKQGKNSSLLIATLVVLMTVSGSISYAAENENSSAVPLYIPTLGDQSAYTLNPSGNKNIITLYNKDENNIITDAINYEVTLKNYTTNSNGSGILYFKWDEDGNGNKIFGITEARYNQFTGKYNTGNQAYSPITNTYEYTSSAINKNFLYLQVKNDSAYSNFGGAINNANNIKDINGDFVSNKVISTKYSGKSAGGAIYNYQNSKIGNITGNFLNNYSIAGTSYSGATSDGGAIYNGYNAEIGNIVGTFVNNYVDGYHARGGAIYNYSQGKIKSITGNFVGNHSKSGGAIENDGSINEGIEGSFIGNYVFNGSAIGGAINNKGQIIKITGDYIGNYAFGTSEAIGGTINNSGEIGNIIGDHIGNYVSANDSAKGGTIHNNGKIGDIRGNFFNNYANAADAKGGAIYNSGEIGAQNGGIINSYFANNYTESSNNNAKGGAIYTTKNLNIISDNGTTEFTNNYTLNNGTKDYNAIYVDNADAELKFELRNNGITILNDNINGADGYKVNITGDGTGTFYLFNDINNANLYLGNATLNAINNIVQTHNFNSLTLNGVTNFVADVDLYTGTMDRLKANSYGQHTGTLNVIGMNILQDMEASKDSVDILFADEGLKDKVTYTPNTTTRALSPIFQYDVTYESREDNNGYFVFKRPGEEPTPDNDGGSGGTGGSVSPNNYRAFNPAVLGSSTAATVGAIGTMNQTFNNTFQNVDYFMNIPLKERLAIKNRNRYALDSNTTDVVRFSPLYQPADEQQGIWVKPYATFENVPIKNGPKVSNIAYGTLIGFDTEMQSIKHGWDRVLTGFVGYHGASQRYSNIDSVQNGGMLGGSITLYKGNFFNATTLSVGANVASNDTMYGHEDFTMLLSGVANKTGYNIEFNQGKVILQPSMLMSYSFINTFDFTNAANVRIDSKPLHSIQLAPGVKLIGNLKNGWQPYAKVSMVWNLMGETNAHANNVKLPEMSIKPYVQYGVGIQKRIKDNFMGYGQAMIQNGGRNGVSLSAGFRWAIGSDNKKNNDKKISNKKNIAKNKDQKTISTEPKVLRQLSQNKKASR